MSFGRRVFAVALMCGVVGAAGRPQQTPGVQPQAPGFPGLSQEEEKRNPNSKEVQERQEKARSSERQRRLVADTDKLLALATQLHEDVGRTDKNILSLDVVRRAEEIEKLARSVKDRMKG